MLEPNSNRLPVNRKLLARFFSKIKIDPNVSFKDVPCWLWTAWLDRDGYANFRGPNSIRAARTSYEMFVGIIPDGFQPDHLCRVRACVNPVHLEAVTPQVNTLRGEGPAAKNAVKTHCKQGHEFTPENTFSTPSLPNSRRCRECYRARDRANPRNSRSQRNPAYWQRRRDHARTHMQTRRSLSKT